MTFEEKLTGGHPNSLGGTLDVVEEILADRSKLEELYRCYFSDDEVVRLRTSSAWKRITQQHLDWFLPYLDRFLSEISTINQASTKWTLAYLFLYTTDSMSAEQLDAAKGVVKAYLETERDWIVLKNSMDCLGTWARDDDDLRVWLEPHLRRLRENPKKVVPKTASKWLADLGYM